MTLPTRPGMTLPLPGHLHAQRDRLVELADLGYTDVWSAESDGPDAFTPLALAAAWEPRLRLGTAIVPAFTRAPACMAQSVAALADAAPGRFAFGVGSSSNVIVREPLVYGCGSGPANSHWAVELGFQWQPLQDKEDFALFASFNFNSA